MNRLNLSKLFLIIVFCLNITSVANAEYLLFPDFNKRQNITVREDFKDKTVFKVVNKKQKINDNFDKLIVTVYKNNLIDKTEKISDYIDKNKPTEYGGVQTYIIKNDENEYFYTSCRADNGFCEIKKYFYSPENNLVEVNYKSSNVWHFQNNIGSYINIVELVKMFDDSNLPNDVPEKVLEKI